MLAKEDGYMFIYTSTLPPTSDGHHFGHSKFKISILIQNCMLDKFSFTTYIMQNLDWIKIATKTIHQTTGQIFLKIVFFYLKSDKLLSIM